jgi:hypothetical protein
MNIALVYIGHARHQQTSKNNHKKLLELLQSKYTVTVYNFLKTETNPLCPFDTSGGAQVWDFLTSCERVTEEIVIKIRTDVWFTKSAMETTLSELEEIAEGRNDIAFLGLAFTTHYDQIMVRSSARVGKKVTDFVIIARKSELEPLDSVVAKLTAAKDKSGNKMFRAVMSATARAVNTSCQMYLLRHDYKEPNNWQIYSEWAVELKLKSAPAWEWVTQHQELIQDF